MLRTSGGKRVGHEGGPSRPSSTDFTTHVAEQSEKHRKIKSKHQINNNTEADSLDRAAAYAGETAAGTKVETITVNNAADTEQVRAALQDLQQRQSEITANLDAKIAQHDDFLRQMRRLDLSRARIGAITVGARGVSRDLLAEPAATARRISAAVERLDLEQTRVKATLDVVEQVAELKSCVLGVVGSMGAPQDWETAAEYINRASRISKDVLESGFAEQIVPTAEVPDAPKVTLENATQSLCDLFLREFNKAVEQSDGAGITRFFKIFPLIDRSKEGLDAYGKYVCQGVALRARVRLQSVSTASRHDGSVYVNALTKLFEHIAQVIEGHSGLVERHYGAGTMVKVMERLHKEANVQGGIILDTWTDERSISRKLTDVKSYAFSFLVQSFLPKARGVAGTPRSQSPANREAAESAQNSADDGVDMKEIDKLLNEMVSMISHWSLYLRFVSSRALTSENDELTLEPLKVPAFISESNLPRKVAKILMEPFGTFAMFFLRRSVEKAFQLDESPTDLTLNLKKTISTSPPLITSAVDDVMYVVNQVLQRALATSQVDSVTSVLSTISRVLGSDFIGMIQRKMRDQSYPKAAIQGAVPPEDLVISFLVLVNNLEVATDYIKRIISPHVEASEDTEDGASRSSSVSRNGANHHERPGGTPRPLSELFPIGRDAASIRAALINVETAFESKATELTNEGIQVAFSQVVKPRMRPLLGDAFRDTDYSASAPSHHPASSFQQSYNSNNTDSDIDSEHDGGSGSGSGVRHRAGEAWELTLRPLKRILTETNYERLFIITVRYFAELLEKRIWSYHGRVGELGAIKFERDVNDLVNVVTRGGITGTAGPGAASSSSSSFRLRMHFARSIEIVMLMNLEEEEWLEMQLDLNSTDASGGTDTRDGPKLNEVERTRARTMVRGRE